MSLRPGKARALLKEAGYDASRPCTSTILTDNDKQVFANIATLLKVQYRNWEWRPRWRSRTR